MSIERRCLVALFVMLTAGGSARAQIPSSEYGARRDSVARHIRDGLVVAFGAREPVDDLAIFRQLPGFAYLTGVAESDAVFLMTAQAGRVQRALLFLPAKDPRMALYTGFLPAPAEVRARYGLELRTMEGLGPVVDSMLAQGLAVWNVPDVASRDFLRLDTLTRATRFFERLRAARSKLEVRSAQALLDSLRVRKSAAEQALLRRAVEITMKGHEAAIRAVAPDRSEAVAQAESDRVFRMLGDGPSYGAIVGSGPNSTSFHYRANNRIMRAGEVVVMDMGAAYQGYAADITRTVPVSGQFTPEQRTIYDIVLASQKAAETVGRAGAPVARGDSAIRAVHAEALTRLGLIEAPDALIDAPWTRDCSQRPLSCRQVFLFMAHGPGHGIGLEVHDPGG